MFTHAHKRSRTLAALGAAVALVAGAALQSGAGVAVAAPPTGPKDSTAVPHYFGPWPNWANSPLTLSKASVQITDGSGSGSGATAVAQVDPKTGAISAIDVTSPGHDYQAGTTVTVTGGSADASGTPTISTSGVVTGFTGVVAGSGYGAFDVALSGGGGSGATAIGSGGVDAVTISDGGSGYTMPTVDFGLPDDPNGTAARGHVPMIANGDPADGMDSNGTITTVVVDEPGSGYLTAPDVMIRNGTIFDPINLSEGGSLATAKTTLKLTAVNVDSFGSGYTGPPDVAITDPTGSGSGASATAMTDSGAITAIAVADPGAEFLTKGMRKFVDDLPGVCTPGGATDNCPTDGTKFIPNAVPAEKKYNGVASDEYVIGLVQYRTSFSSDIPQGTLVRGYVQLETPDNAAISQHVPLTNELMDGTKVPVKDSGNQVYGVTAPQYLGPFIGATKNKPVRITFHNYLPTGAAGDLFLPVDSTMMGSGMGPMTMDPPTDANSVMDQVRNPDCTQGLKSSMCFTDNRATLHLHGGITPWISDGTPHQWITPANESTMWPQGVSVQNVPDMTTDGTANGPVVCAAKDDGCETFYYTNQQSARLMFYHDHSWGITRLNVYAGEAAGYTITDAVEKRLVADGVIPGADSTIPLVVQDKTFVPSDGQIHDTTDAAGNTSYGQDPTWDTKRWGGAGSLWYHHVYMPAQNPGDPSGMSAYGRWMYGPWFWPPASDTKYGPIPNPYYDANCKLDDPSTWQYQTDPFCEPQEIPGTPNISAGMEQFNDTPIVNGVAYPKVTLQPKSYRLRLLNAANDRFFNLQWYVADPTQGDGTTEVALDPAQLAAAQTDPTISPDPVDKNKNAAGPDWVQIANEGGFLPAPAVIDGQQPTTYITDPTRFDVGNVDKHSMLIAPAERADAIVDFSKFAGKTLILYNDAPAAFPARVPQYDYYTGAPDLSPAGAPTPLPGYGPNTRTVMQVTIAGNAAPAFDLTKLRNAFKHNVNGTGVFESGQHPTIVGQAAYNSAYGSDFAAGSNCNAPGSTLTKCDGLVRVSDTTTFSFNTLKTQNAKMTMHLEPKAIHDEMNASTFDEFGRMTANLGVEAQPPTPGLQNVTLYPYINPSTELIDGTNLPKAGVTVDPDSGLPTGEAKVTPIATMSDGTQIWRFTHNGVDTHPIHFHLYDVQVLNRVTWDNIIIPPDPEELGWKDTVRMSPLEDTIVALRPVVPQLPFEIPNSIRPLDPMMPAGSTMGFNNIDPQGNPTGAIVNQLVNFGWEYVFHCHILSHEEMDMMRPVTLAMPPVAPDGLTAAVTGSGKSTKVVLTWNDNSIAETSTEVQRTTDGTTWTTVGTVASPLNVANTKGQRTLTDAAVTAGTPYLYRVVALNTVGYGAGFPSMTVRSQPSDTVGVNKPATPTGLTATILSGPQLRLTWTDNATNESGYQIERAVGNGAFTVLTTLPAQKNTGSVSYTDKTVTLGSQYSYRVTATNVAGSSSVGPVTVIVDVPPVPTGLTGTAAGVNKNSEKITFNWQGVTGQTGYTIQWSTSSTFTTVSSANVAANATTYTTGNVNRGTWYVRIRANNVLGSSAWSSTETVAPAP